MTSLERIQAGQECYAAGTMASNPACVTSSPPDTALRDITDLVERGVLMRDSAGDRSTSYSLRAAE